MKKILVSLILGATFIGCTEEENKTAYVDTTRLIREYSEMKDVESEFTAKSEKIKQQLDSAAQEFQQEVMEYQENMATLSNSERQATESKLMQKQQMLQQQQQTISGQLRNESDAVIDSLVTKVKDYVKAYGEEHDYTYIFGSNESANIMYAEEGLDITDEILKELNGGTASDSTSVE
ncbi:MAG TPA: OmpH family outer membrane protein [Salinimicrobium sp.]|nr:OmpH family outer membrane protein [Salinimicrobium sp.]